MLRADVLASAIDVYFKTTYVLQVWRPATSQLCAGILPAQQMFVFKPAYVLLVRMPATSCRLPNCLLL